MYFDCGSSIQLYASLVFLGMHASRKVQSWQKVSHLFGYYTGPVNSADSTDFTGPDKTHSLVLKHATLFVFCILLVQLTDITVVVSEKLLDLWIHRIIVS